MHVLSGRLLFRPLHSIFPQSWHACVQKLRPPLPLQSFDPHLTQWRMRLVGGSAESASPARFASDEGPGALRSGCW